ncbi:patatin-like phospholipase family protein [Roseimaritima sediminicola]|uniref:patatin-like phospholipase family protein n=1 Tax=Roseimaritima sediminicola TaxID=2662066 RepID=UPI0012982A94|nr:patatin-like phospholipase family protein [Roseimaritima sediminicola]
MIRKMPGRILRGPMLNRLGSVLPQSREPVRTPVVALGGGGARGIAHLGVLEQLQQSGCQIARMVGVSIGSLVAAMCSGGQIAQAQQAARDYLFSERFRSHGHLLPGTEPAQFSPEASLLTFFDRIKRLVHNGRRLNRLMNHPSLLPENILVEAVETLVPDIDITETQIPLRVIAADLKSGRPVVLRSGSLRTAVQASASIPGVFPPVPLGDKLLCDIGGIDSLPSHAAREQADDFLIAVDVGPETAKDQDYHRAIDVLMRMEEIAEWASRQQAYATSDLVIRPHVGDCAWYDFDRFDDLVAAGREAACKALRRFAHPA